MDRREFLKEAAGLYLTIYPAARLIQTFKDFSEKDANDYIDRLDKTKYPFDIADFSVNGLNVKFCGVTHVEKFFKQHERLFDGLVSKSTSVVSEGDLSVLSGRSTGSKFYKNIADLCAKHNKSWINVDPQTYEADTVSIFSNLGFMMCASICGFQALKSNGRRSFIKYFGLGAALTYLYMADFPGSFLYHHMDPQGKNSEYTYGYVVDYRNLRVADGLEVVPRLLRKEEISSGDYVLAVYGAGHTDGVKDYAGNRVLRDFKRPLYPQYNLLGDDYARRYDFIGGNWVETEKKKF